MIRDSQALKFSRRIAFGLDHGQIPPRPLEWAQAQVGKVPPIDILNEVGKPNRNLPADIKLLSRIPEVMTAYRNSWNAVDQMFAQDPNMPQAQRRAMGRRLLFFPYRELEHWKELQARLSTAFFSDQPVFERFWHFWSNHFMVAPNTDNNDTTVGPYQRALRDHLTGSFRDLLWNAVTHPSMLIYLDNYRSVGPNSAARKQGHTKDSINENLGRELLELFTLSPAGGYTQADVEQVTLILTGWTFAMPNSNQAKPLFPSQNAPAFMHGTVFAQGRHEPGPQKVLGKVYAASVFRPKSKLEDLVTDLAQHPATARHLAQKLCVYFIDDDPDPQAVALVEQAFINSKGDLPTVHKAVLQAAWDGIERKRKFQNPEAWLIQVLRLLEVPLPQNAPELEPSNQPTTSSIMQDLGQPLPFSPQPNGWPIFSDEWISKELLDRRLRALQFFIQKSPLVQGEGITRLHSKVVAHLGAESKALKAIDHEIRSGSPKKAALMWLASPDMLWS